MPVKHWLVVTLSTLFIARFASPTLADVIADSIQEFSFTQGQGGWTYGIYSQTLYGLPYQPDRFTSFDVANVDEASWKASNALVPSTDPGQRDNNRFLNLNANGGHPTGTGIGEQDRILWAVRRYTSEVSGPISIQFDLRKVNTVNENGGGITGRIFVDGVELFSQYIANDDGVGVQAVRTANVQLGSHIDFAIDPLGVATSRDSDPSSPRADGSHFSAVISTGVIPEPSTLVLLGGTVVWIARRRCKTSPVARGFLCNR